MDKKPLRPNGKRARCGPGYEERRLYILVIFMALISYAAYHQPSTLKEIPLTQAIQRANAGKYKKIEVNGDELNITKK
jgi:hypothetical protein